MDRFRDKQSMEGFTLLELLFVVIIIGILATIAIPQFGSFAERAAGAQAAFQLSEMRNLEVRYKGDPDQGGTTSTYGTLAQIGLIPTQNEWTYDIVNVTTAAVPADLSAAVPVIDIRARRLSATGAVVAGANEMRMDINSGALCVFDNVAATNAIYRVGKDAAAAGTDCF